MNLQRLGSNLGPEQRQIQKVQCEGGQASADTVVVID